MSTTLRVIISLPIISCASASELEATCSAGQQCEQDDTGMLQKQRKLKLHRVTKYSPNNTKQCYDVPGINPTLDIVFDDSCPGLCCFEDYPCKYINCTASLAQEAKRVKYSPNNTKQCYDVPGINPTLDIVFDDSCPGLCCFEDYPCKYINCTASLAQEAKKMK